MNNPKCSQCGKPYWQTWRDHCNKCFFAPIDNGYHTKEEIYYNSRCVKLIGYGMVAKPITLEWYRHITVDCGRTKLSWYGRQSIRSADRTRKRVKTHDVVYGTRAYRLSKAEAKKLKNATVGGAFAASSVSAIGMAFKSAVKNAQLFERDKAILNNIAKGK